MREILGGELFLWRVGLQREGGESGLREVLLLESFYEGEDILLVWISIAREHRAGFWRIFLRE